ncbi:MAG: 1-deoxy-D-xylulose-5-phosphate reductoisomerase [Gammaproteobacteria bacterium]|nr:1-deoxy-D-xylulose-5-phosphate reductoisomerase [Gammaproteobacteria bacterium]
MHSTHMKLTILGSTGSIGQSTLALIEQHRDRFEVVALTASSNWELLAKQCQRFKPKYAVLTEEQAVGHLEKTLKTEGLDTTVLYGQKGLTHVASLQEVDTVMAAIVGAAGLIPSFSALSHGKTVLLANKEALVMAGSLFIQEAQKNHATLIPVDSEHNAIFQCLPSSFSVGCKPEGIARLTLTASGGPFLHTPIEKLASVTPEEASAHPKWSMGKKISVDSATMMNKGFEVIEAHWLFDMPPSSIQVVIHPESIVHSFVHCIDGAILAELSQPDMQIPIRAALAWPNRMVSPIPSLEITELNTLQFLPIDRKRFPLLSLAYAVLEEKGTAPVSLNAANEIAVEAFLARKLSFMNISTVVHRAIEKLPVRSMTTLQEVLAADLLARTMTRELIER